MGASPFLTAEWRWLAMLNYEVDPAVLREHVPPGTELDTHDGKTYVSVVGLLFRDTRLRGVYVPFHTDFEEVNLRFYVRRTLGRETRRGVVFIKELVPRLAVALVARWTYGERYAAVPMRNDRGKYGSERRIVYEWTYAKQGNSLAVRTDSAPFLPKEGSHEAFITEHYWGYARPRQGGTLEYEVEHPRWQVRAARAASLSCNVAAHYGEAFVPFLAKDPASAFLAEGSPVKIFPGRRIS